MAAAPAQAVTYAVQAARGQRRHDRAAGRVSGRGCLGVGAAGRPDLPRSGSPRSPSVVEQAAHLRGPGRRPGGRGLRAPGRRQRRQPGLPAYREPFHGHPRAAPAGQAARRPGWASPAGRSSCSRGRATRPSPTTWCTTSWPAAVSRRRSMLERPRWRAAWSRSPAGWGSLSRPSRRPDSSPSAGSSSAPVTVAPPLQFSVSWRRDTISRAVRQFLAVVSELAWR